MADTSSITKRLYDEDSYLRAFEARVLDVSPHAGAHAVILDRTAFFPTSGGQPHDRGTLGGMEVTDAVPAEALEHAVAAAHAAVQQSLHA